MIQNIFGFLPNGELPSSQPAPEACSENERVGNETPQRPPRPIVKADSHPLPAATSTVPTTSERSVPQPASRPRPTPVARVRSSLRNNTYVCLYDYVQTYGSMKLQADWPTEHPFLLGLVEDAVISRRILQLVGRVHFLCKIFKTFAGGTTP